MPDAHLGAALGEQILHCSYSHGVPLHAYAQHLAAQLPEN